MRGVVFGLVPGFSAIVATAWVAAGCSRAPTLTIRNQSPQKRLLTTPEVAAMVSLLCSDEGRGINGQALVLDGGGLLA